MIFNRNTLKINYSCADNISNIRYYDNKNLIDKSIIDDQRTNKFVCNCGNKEDCLVGGMYNSEDVVNQATIFPMENIKEERIYIGIFAGNRK